MHGQIYEVVCYVESRGTRVADLVEVVLTFGEGTGVDHFTFCEEDELVEEGGYVGAGLVNCEDYCAIEVSCQSDQTFNHIVCIIGIKS